MSASKADNHNWLPRFRRVILAGTRLRSDLDGDLQTIFPSAMILRHSSFWSSLVFSNLLFALGVMAQDGDNPFNCRVRTNDLTYDLTPLQGEHTVSRTRDTPPSSWVDSVRFDLCADLKLQDGVAAGDQVRSHPDITSRITTYDSPVHYTVSCGDESMSHEDEPKGRQLRSRCCRDTSRSVEHTGPKV